MEGDHLKSLWLDYDNKLEKHLKLNEEILRKLNFRQAEKALRKPFISELLNIAATFLFAVYLLTVSFLVFDQFKFSIPGLICGVCTIGIMLFSILRVSKFSRMDLYTKPVLETQKQLYDLQMTRYRLGRPELLLTVIALITVWPLVLFTGFQIDLYENIMSLAFALIITIAIAVPTGIWHERFYHRKLETAEKLLQEIQILEKDSQ